jgi:hypothetical protein
MSPTAQSNWRTALNSASTTLVYTGAIVVLIGDGVLHDFFHLDWLHAVFEGMGTGFTICFLGAMLKWGAEKKE